MSWIRDLFGIRKDIAETKKAMFETEKLEKELEEKESLIEKATFEQIEKYDIKTERLKKIIEDTRISSPILDMTKAESKKSRVRLSIIIISGIFLIALIYLLFRFVLF